MAEAPLPEGKRRNSFTGEIIDKKPLSVAPSPADQRILSMYGDKPLIELCKEVVDSIGDDSGPDVETHVGPSLTEDSHPRLAPLPYVPDTQKLVGPLTPEESDEPVQHIDALPATAQALADGAELADVSDARQKKVIKHAAKAEKDVTNA
jgi:hypothetical protein